MTEKKSERINLFLKLRLKITISIDQNCWCKSLDTANLYKLIEVKDFMPSNERTFQCPLPFSLIGTIYFHFSYGTNIYTNCTFFPSSAYFCFILYFVRQFVSQSFRNAMGKYDFLGCYLR